MSKFTVCPRCKGEGRHVNPAIDGNGITADEMDELGDDFREDYLSGVYDVTCDECHGQRVVRACRCGRPVARGVYIPFTVFGVGDDDPRPYSACYEHLIGDELDSYRSELELAVMYEAERRMGA